jgi:hypothetical protein
MTSFISSSPFQNTKQFLQIRSLAPGIARRSSERFQLRRQSGEQLLPICASSGESEGTSAFVSSRASSGCVWFVDWISESPAIDGFPLGSGEGLLPRWEPPLLYLGFLRVLCFPSLQGLPHSPLTFPGGAPFSLLGGGCDGGARASAPRARARARRSSAAKAATGQPDPTSPAQLPPLTPLSSMDGRK